MFRAGTKRSLLGSLQSSASPALPGIRHQTLGRTQLASSARTLNLRRPQRLALTSYKPFATSVQRYASSSKTPYEIDPKQQAEVMQQKLKPEPEEVSTSSTTSTVLDQGGEERETDMLAGVKADLKTIRETFALTEVPREAYYIGLAGVLPYLATSASTVYLAWDINHAAIWGQGFLLSGRTAELLLHIIEPLQVGYGAVIISFLGAIHWGLEWAQYGGMKRYRRYAIGVVAPAIAWPTILFPVEYALITQFLSFNFLYFVDASATKRGWCPPWYTTYRFVLTFIVGVSIVLSLIGRGQIADQVGRLPGPADRIRALKDAQWENLEKEEEEKQKRLAAEEEESMAGGDGDDEEGGEEEEE